MRKWQRIISRGCKKKEPLSFLMAGERACLFCQIARSATSTPLLHTDDTVVAFQDINPSAFRFFLCPSTLEHLFKHGFDGKLSPARYLGLALVGVSPEDNFDLLLHDLTRHYLVIPVKHISTVKDLRRTTDDFSLVSHMLDVGKGLLHRDAPDSNQYKFGFHEPPFNSVDHLHLHCLALPFIPKWKHVKYMSLGPIGGFIEAEKMLEKIKP